MDIYILATVILTSIVQSLFGVGVLLFGTPVLLLLDYDFFDTLMILLPISAIINLMQISQDFNKINKEIYKYILLLTVPFIMVFLFIVSKNIINLDLVMGLFLILILLKNNVNTINIYFSKLLDYNKTFYIAMGIIHGLTNLGGAMLSAKVFSTNLNKYEKRATIAVSYLTFALFQIITIFYLDKEYNEENLFYILIGTIIYLIVNKMFFNKISENKYQYLFSIFLFITGVLLIMKGV